MGKMARPRIKIDWDEFDKLCSLLCTQKEIAEWFGCTDDTIQTAVKRKYKVGFSEYYKKKSCGGKVSLRRAQYLLATEDRNPTMLIWLGKQHLEQQEPQRQVDNVEINLDYEAIGKSLAKEMDEADSAS
jgi:hypothetical protein